MAALPAWVKTWLTVDDSMIDNQFTLTSPSDFAANDSQDDHPAEGEGQPADKAEDRTGRKAPKHRGWGESGETAHPLRPMPLAEWVSAQTERVQDGLEMGPESDRDRITRELAESRAHVQTVFRIPENSDAIVRNFTVGAPDGWPAFAVYFDGISDKLIINTHVLEPLMLLVRARPDVPTAERIQAVEDVLLPSNQLTIEHTWSKVVAAVLAGSSAVFIEGCDAALIVETKGWEHRSVSTPQTESVVRGPHDAFTENFRANTGLVRARLRSERLVTEMLSVGKLAKTDVAIMHIEGLTNPNLVAEVRRRIEGIDVDYLSESGTFEQYIEDSPWLSLHKFCRRNDRTASRACCQKAMWRFLSVRVLTS